MGTASTERPDRLALLLEWGLAAAVVGAPLPFGAVQGWGRAALEIGAVVLLAVWLLRSLWRPTYLPPAASRLGLGGLVMLAVLQLVPLGSPLVARLSPGATEIRQAAVLDAEDRAAEAAVLGQDPLELDATASLTLDPAATASALRTGVACAALFLVSATVVAARGARGLALALLLSAAFQGLYGLLVLATGHEMIWNVPKLHYLNSATGTFVNRNHFAGYLALAIPAGMGLILSNLRRSRERVAEHKRVEFWETEGSRNLLLGLLLAAALAGLFTSFSRAGTLLCVAALGWTLLAAGGRRATVPRLGLAVLLLLVAALPMTRIAPERLAERYSQASEDFFAPGGRATVWRDTVAMVGEFPLTGSGFGTFAAVYPVFRAPEVRLFYAHAHNDLLQFLAEGGAVGLVLLGLIAVPLARASWACLSGEHGRLAIGLAAGLVAILVHGLIDFNFHIPSNLTTTAVIAGAVQALPWRSRR